MKSKQRKVIPLVVLFSCLAIIAAPGIPKSYAHAYMTESGPANGETVSYPPSSVNATFSDPVDIHYSKIKVQDSNGNEIDNKDSHYIGTNHETIGVTMPANLANGIYTATWTVLDETDGHVTTASFVFGVGETVPQAKSSAPTVSITDIISVPFSLARFPAQLGQVIVVGTAFLSIWMWKPLARIPWLVRSVSSTRVQMEKNTARMILAGSVILAGAGVAMIVAEAVSINSSIYDAIGTKYGQTWVLRMALSSALAGVAFIYYQKQKASETEIGRSWKWLVFALGIGILVTDTMISHAEATGLSLPPALDFVHDVAASLWIGGLIYGAFVVLPALKRSSDHLTRLSVLSIMIPRFTVLVVAILGVVAVTGPTLLYTLESSFSLTLASIYGKVLIIKLGLAAAMIALGGYHEVATRSKSLATLKAVSARGGSSNTEDSGARVLESKFHRNIMIEALIGIALIGSVSVLVDSGLPATEFQNQLPQGPSLPAFAAMEGSNVYSETAYGQNGTRVMLTIDPYYSGINNMRITFMDSHGNILPMKSARFTYMQPDKGIGPVMEDVNPDPQGAFSFSTNTFAISGHWTLQVEGVQSAANSLNVVGSFSDLYLSPRIDTVSAAIKEYAFPQNDSRPLFPVYDKVRNAVWIGDALPDSGRIYSFDLESHKFTAHSLKGISAVTLMRLGGADGTLWYIDPLSKSLGNYNPDTDSNAIYSVPAVQGSILSGLAMDGSGNLWISISSISGANQVLKFYPSNRTFSAIPLGAGSQPQGLAVDPSTGDLWIAESGSGKIARINTATGTITEYPAGNKTLATPTAMLVDPLTGKVYVSEHDGREISSFDQILGTFTKYTLDQNQNDLPFGMVFDNNHDLWVAQHTMDSISVINPRTGDTKEFSIPSSGSLTQHITSDSRGEIIMVEQGTHLLGILTATSGPSTAQSGRGALPFEYPGMSLGLVAGPSIAVAIVALSFFYTKSVRDSEETMNWIAGLGGKNGGTSLRSSPAP